MGGKSSPPTPDYTALANTQGANNLETAQQQSRLNNPNMITPYGNQTYTEGAQIGTDANGIPIYARPTMTQTLSPEQQQLYETGTGIKQGALNILQGDMPNIQQALSGSFNFNPSPIYGGYMPGTGPTASMQYGPGYSGPIQASIQPGQNFIPSVEAAQYAQGAMFLDPQFRQAQNDLDVQLANQGIYAPSQPAGTGTASSPMSAWDRAQQNLALQRTGAYQNNINNAITQGQQAAQGIFGMNQAAGQFANSAQAQQYQELLNTMQNRNAAISQQAQIAGNETGIANAAQNQGFGQYVTQRTLPINMLTALLSTGQVTNPTFQATQPTAINAAPIMQGGIAQGQANAAQQSANAGKVGSGLGALGQVGAALPWATMLA